MSFIWVLLSTTFLYISFHLLPTFLPSFLLFLLIVVVLLLDLFFIWLRKLHLTCITIIVGSVWISFSLFLWIFHFFLNLVNYILIFLYSIGLLCLSTQVAVVVVADDDVAIIIVVDVVDVVDVADVAIFLNVFWHKLLLDDITRMRLCLLLQQLLMLLLLLI